MTENVENFFPPKCTGCGIELDQVKAIGTTLWSFEERHYFAMNSKDDVDFICPSCNCKLNNLFPKGIYYHGI